MKIMEEIKKLRKLDVLLKTTPIVQKLKLKVMEKDNTITVQKQEISDICSALDKATAELTTLQDSTEAEDQ